MNIFQLDDIKLKRKKKSRRKKLEDEGQLNLFSGTASVFELSQKSFFDEALRLDAEGNPDAIEFYKKAIDNNEYPADAYCNIAILEADNGNTSKAFKYFLEVLKIEPAHCECHFNLGNLYFENEDYKLAELHYKIALEFDDEPNTYFNLALLYLKMNLPEDSEKNLHEYLSRVQNEDTASAEELLNQIKIK